MYQPAIQFPSNPTFYAFERVKAHNIYPNCQRLLCLSFSGFCVSLLPQGGIFLTRDFATYVRSNSSHPLSLPILHRSPLSAPPPSPSSPAMFCSSFRSCCLCLVRRTKRLLNFCLFFTGVYHHESSVRSKEESHCCQQEAHPSTSTPLFSRKVSYTCLPIKLSSVSVCMLLWWGL